MARFGHQYIFFLNPGPHFIFTLVPSTVFGIRHEKRLLPCKLGARCWCSKRRWRTRGRPARRGTNRRCRAGRWTVAIANRERMRCRDSQWQTWNHFRHLPLNHPHLIRKECDSTSTKKNFNLFSHLLKRTENTNFKNNINRNVLFRWRKNKQQLVVQNLAKVDCR